MLAVNMRDTAEKVRKYFEKSGFTFKPVMQKADEVSRQYGVRAYPTNYVIGADGKIVHRSVSYDEDALKAALEKAAPRKK